MGVVILLTGELADVVRALDAFGHDLGADIVQTIGTATKPGISALHSKLSEMDRWITIALVLLAVVIFAAALFIERW